MTVMLKSMIAPMMLAAVAVTSVAVAQTNQPTQRGQMGGGMMQPGDGPHGNMMREGMMPGTSVPPEQMMANCRSMMQGGATATDDATKAMLDRCRSMMQQESPQETPAAPEKKE